ncbi:MAG: hypothetical protein ACTSXV_02040 [Alphaproteobacteria bacterium]
MSKSLIFSLFTVLAIFVWQGTSIAQTSRSQGGKRSSVSNARYTGNRGGSGGKYTRINAGRARTAGVGITVPAGSAPSDKTDIKDSEEGKNNTPVSNIECVDRVTQCLEANNLCGSGLFGCQGRLPLIFDPNDSIQMATAVANLVANEGAMCADVMTQCQCYYNAEPYSNANCDLVWEQIVRQINTSSYNMGECQDAFMSCAKTECGGENYSDCVDLIDTVVSSRFNDRIDGLSGREFLRDWLSNNSSPTTQALSESLQSLLMQRLARCETNVLTKCDGYTNPLSFPVPQTNPVVDAERAMLYFFQDFARKAETGLIDYQETHAKEKWLKAEECVDEVDTCMQTHCGNDYKKCLHEDGTIDEIVTKNFKTLCQKTLIKCSEIRVEVGLPGYAFLQNPGVDGVEAVWEEFLNKRMLAHGTAVEVERRELDRQLDILISSAQKECQETGGEFAYKREILDIYATKFGDSNTDDYKGDSGVIHQEDTGFTHRAGIETGRFGTDDEYKSRRFYNRATCTYRIILNYTKKAININKRNFQSTPVFVDLRDNVMCDQTLFPSEAQSGLGLGRVAGGALGLLAGATGGIFAGKALVEDHKTAGAVGGGVLGGTAGVIAGTKAGEGLANINRTKNWSCSVFVSEPLVLRNPRIKYIPVAKWGQAIILPPRGIAGTTNVTSGAPLYGSFTQPSTVSTSSRGSAFDALDDFYKAHPELIVQRGEYNN